MIGWIIGGIAILWALAHSHASQKSPAPVQGGNNPVCSTNQTVATLSQALYDHVTGTPTCPVQSTPVAVTVQENSVAGGQPVNPVETVQVANSNQGGTGQVPLIQPGVIVRPGMIDHPSGIFSIDTPGIPVPSGGTDGIVQGPISPEPSVPLVLQPTPGNVDTVISSGAGTCGTPFKIFRRPNGSTYQAWC